MNIIVFKSFVRSVEYSQMDQIFMQQLQHISIDVIMAVATLSVGFLNALVYCYFGSKATESFEKMGDLIFELKWYELPIQKQKYFILMAANMRKPLHYHGFGVFLLNLDTFVQVRATSNYLLVVIQFIF